MKKLFTNDKFFLVSVILAVAFETLYSAHSIIAYPKNTMTIIPLLIRIGCVLVLFNSYRTHSKNVMKGMIGALLMAQMLTAISSFSWVAFPADLVFSSCFLALSALMFITHFVINSDRHSSPKAIRLNQIIALLLFINNAIWEIYSIAFGIGAVATISALLDLIGFAGMVSVIVCVESRLDAYKLDREAAGWTEEKGYPEGYVHEYEKTRK